MRELIGRLRGVAGRIEHRQMLVARTLREAAAALEDAREDVERYRHLRSNESSGSADLCICHVRWAKRGGETTEYVLLVENEADAAIDQARGKGVADES